jgi:hypothetical protein
MDGYHQLHLKSPMQSRTSIPGTAHAPRENGASPANPETSKSPEDIARERFGYHSQPSRKRENAAAPVRGRNVNLTLRKLGIRPIPAWRVSFYKGVKKWSPLGLIINFFRYGRGREWSEPIPLSACRPGTLPEFARDRAVAALALERFGAFSLEASVMELLPVKIRATSFLLISFIWEGCETTRYIAAWNRRNGKRRHFFSLLG